MMIANAATRLHLSILPQNPNIAELLDASSDDMSPEDPSPKEDMFAASDWPSIIHPQLENIGFCWSKCIQVRDIGISYDYQLTSESVKFLIVQPALQGEA